MEPIDPDIVQIINETGHQVRLQDYLKGAVFENLKPFLANDYSVDARSIPVEGQALTVFIATKEDKTPHAMAIKMLLARPSVVTSHMRALIINAAKDVQQNRLRQKIFWQWVMGMAIVVIALAMVVPSVIFRTYGYDDLTMLLTFPAAIVIVFGGCGAIPWTASQVFFERAWRRDPTSQLIYAQLKTLSTD